MNYQGGFTTLLSPDATQTGIDSVAYEVYERESQPSALSSRDTTFFNQKTMNTMAWIWDEYSGVPNIEVVDEQEIVPTVSTFIGNQTVKRVVVYKNDFPVSWEARKTDRIDLRERIGRSIGDSVRRTQDYKAIIDCYGDAFDGTNHTTPDGLSLANNAHVTLNGATVDNLSTLAMDPDNFDDVVTLLEAQPGQHGDMGGNVFSGLAVPRNLYKRAKEVMNSTKEADTAENNLNLFDTDYGTVVLKQSPLLNSTFNSGANANTGFHLVSQQHHINRRVLAEFETEMIEAKNTGTDSDATRVRFAEVTHPETHFGYVGSTGVV